MRKIIKAASVESPNRQYSADLLGFLAEQGLSKDEILDNMMKYFNADDVVACLESIARDYDIPIESCDIINCSTTASSKTEDDWRREYFDLESDPDLDPKRVEDILAINWNSVTAEDSEFFMYDTKMFPDLSVVESVDYADDEEWDAMNNAGYDGGYIIKNRDGSTRYVAWLPYPNNDNIEDVTELVEYAIGNRAYREETKQNDFAAALEDYNKRIADEAYGKRINSSSNVSNVNTSTVSFDFVNDGDYNGHAIIDAVMDILRSYGVNPLGGSFEEVDYSGYPEYADEIVSQCNVDFEWEDDYDADGIQNEIEVSLIPYEVIGVQFNAVGE